MTYSHIDFTIMYYMIVKSMWLNIVWSQTKSMWLNIVWSQAKSMWLNIVWY